ncbi:MAG TPA: response regulator [Ktedonobacteraceae bacterium]|nr:response regulator [Ktedonobacteraceae bacterium]
MDFKGLSGVEGNNFMIGAPKILIIDDSTTSCFYMAQALQKAGYNVITASDGREGMMKLLQEHPQCLILDVILPGISGFALCRQLRTQDALRSLPIIMVSSKNTAIDQSWGLRQGANRYLSKPFTEETLVQAVEEVLPAYVRPVVAAGQVPPQRASATAAKSEALPLQMLIPRLKDSSQIDWASITDRQARLLCAAIDGRRNIESLCVITQLGLTEVINTLRLLLVQRYIEFCNTSGMPIDNSLVLAQLGR